jgi:DNA-binding transcriptional LysR family regulator
MNPPAPNTWLDWERQRAFLAVLGEGSLSGAARVLGLSQPTVRRRIEDLERQVGAPLFTRSPSGLTPTGVARDLGQHARAMATAAEAFMRTASGDADAAEGVVRITASEVIGVEVLPPILAELRAVHPRLVLELSLGSRNEDLMKREADVAVRMSPPAQKALVARRIGAVRLGLFAHRRLIEAEGAPTTLEDLSRLPLIGYESETNSIRALRAMGLTLKREDFVYRTDNDLAQLAAIRAGVGVGVCQTRLGERNPDLVAVLPDAFSFDLDTWIVMHEDLRRVRRVRLVYEALAKGLTTYIRG